MSSWLISFRMACVVLCSRRAVCNCFIKVLFFTLNIAARIIWLYVKVLFLLVFRIKYLTYFFSLKQLVFQLKMSALPFSNPLRYKIVKLYNTSFFAYYTCLLFRTFVVVNIIRFLWSLNTYMGCTDPLQYTFYCLKVLIITKSSLLWILQFNSAGKSFLK